MIKLIFNYQDSRRRKIMKQNKPYEIKPIEDDKEDITIFIDEDTISQEELEAGDSYESED